MNGDNTKKELSLAEKEEGSGVIVEEKETKISELKQSKLKALDEYGLLPKEMMFIYEFVECGGNATVAMAKVNPKIQRASAAVAATRMIQKDNVARALHDYLYNFAASTEVALGKVKQKIHSGRTDEVQLKAADMLLKVQGAYQKAEDKVKPGPIVNITVNLPQQDCVKTYDAEVKTANG